MATLQIKVKPNARVSSLAQLKSPPVDGKANEELIALVAKQFGCGRASVSIQSGASGRMKPAKIEES